MTPLKTSRGKESPLTLSLPASEAKPKPCPSSAGVISVKPLLSPSITKLEPKSPMEVTSPFVTVTEPDTSSPSAATGMLVSFE